SGLIISLRSFPANLSVSEIVGIYLAHGPSRFALASAGAALAPGCRRSLRVSSRSRSDALNTGLRRGGTPGYQYYRAGGMVKDTCNSRTLLAPNGLD
ncbi:MAG TPA: hypothetical protein VMX97_04490, partial [Hyphomicrobiaceae bacterium]|nr:hypothetical protein [Hyphomicrobiaceae bacterium]